VQTQFHLSQPLCSRSSLQTPRSNPVAEQLGSLLLRSSLLLNCMSQFVGEEAFPDGCRRLILTRAKYHIPAKSISLAYTDFTDSTAVNRYRTSTRQKSWPNRDSMKERITASIKRADNVINDWRC
jgi:hypothetical protein